MPFGILFFLNLQYLLLLLPLCFILEAPAFATAYKHYEKFPLLTINKHGITPTRTKEGYIDFNAKLIPWENIKEIFVCKPPFTNKKKAGYRYLGINLTQQNEKAYTKIFSKVKVVTIGSNDKDIPLFVFHPFQKGFIKCLNFYYAQHLEKKI